MKKRIKLILSIDEVKLLHDRATEERKLELEELYPELKPIIIIDRVQTYKDALEVLNRDHFNETNLYPREISRRKLEIIIEALNEGWKADLNNSKQCKWYFYYYGAAAVGVRLCLKNKELADYVGTQFRYLYEEILLG